MTLEEIKAELEAMTGGDVESEHGRADDLLIEAIRYLAPDDCESLIEAYEAVPKWYA